MFSKTNQDAYMEEEGPRGDMTIQSGLSNSTESIDSMKALTAAIEAANAQVCASILFFVTNQHLFCAVCNFVIVTKNVSRYGKERFN